MTDRLDLDRIRDAFEGRLSPEERAALEARRAAEPDLDAVARDFDEVAAAGIEPVAPCTLSFERLALDDVPAGRPALARWAPFVAAAAAVLVLLGGLVLGPRGGGVAEAGPVVLQAVVLDEVAPPEPLPQAALDYTPTGPKGLRFVEGVAAGKALAAAAGRPLVVFVHHPTCPLCRSLERGAFRDPALAPAAGAFVLAQANVMADGGPLLEGLDVGWPVFLVFRADGERTVAFAGADGMDVKSVAALRSALEAAAKGAEPPSPDGAPPSRKDESWDEVHAVARALADAEAAVDLAARVRRLAEAEAAAHGTALSARVHAALSALSDDARRAIEKARDLAAAGQASEAAKTLEEAALRYRGTPHENDLRHVRNRLVADGRFPALEALR